MVRSLPTTAHPRPNGNKPGLSRTSGVENDQPNKPTLALSHADQNCKVPKKKFFFNQLLPNTFGLLGRKYLSYVVHRGGNPRKDA